MSKVNDQPQVGGNHYRTQGTDLQHWDLARIFKLDYFQGQITKYVLRWKHKNRTHESRVQDLHKARQFLDKYIEDVMYWDDDGTVPAQPDAHKYTESLDELRDRGWTIEGYCTDRTQMYKCTACGYETWAFNLDTAVMAHGLCPAQAGSSYVDQDQAKSSDGSWIRRSK